MAEVLLFHHVMGQTPGFFAFADELRQAGHTVHTPNLLDGRHALRDMADTSWLQDRLPFEGNQDGANYFRCGRND